MPTILLALNLLLASIIPSYKLVFFYKILPSNNQALNINFELSRNELCSPIIKNNILYQGMYNNLILAQDIKNKKVLWQYHTIGEPTNTILYKDILIITTVKGYIYALNSKNGGLIWSYNTQKEILSMPVVKNGNVYIQTTLDTLYAFAAADGSLIWQYSSKNILEGLMVHLNPSPYIKNNVLYTGFSNGSAVALDAVTGKLIWIKKPQTIKQLQDIIITPGGNDQIVIFGSYDNGLFCLNKKDGNMVWERRDLTRPIGLYVTDSAVYAATASGRVYRLDARTGDTIWGTDLGHESNPTNIVSFFNSIVIGTQGDKYKGIVILDRDTGNVIKHFEVVSGVSAPPVIVDNNIYAVSNGGFLYCIEQNPVMSPHKAKCISLF